MIVKLSPEAESYVNERYNGHIPSPLTHHPSRLPLLHDRTARISALAGKAFAVRIEHLKNNLA